MSNNSENAEKIYNVYGSVQALAAAVSALASAMHSVSNHVALDSHDKGGIDLAYELAHFTKIMPFKAAPENRSDSTEDPNAKKLYTDPVKFIYDDINEMLADEDLAVSSPVGERLENIQSVIYNMILKDKS